MPTYRRPSGESIRHDVIKRGAEAEIFRTEFLGRNAVVKKRSRKLYRDERLDRMLISQRTRNEARCIVAAREAGVRVPRIYDVDEHEGTITMEFIDGIRLNTLLQASSAAVRHETERKFGEAIALMHRAGLAHGDLTTSNVVVRDGDLYFLDFSMGTRGAGIEMLGVDMRLLREVFRSSHSEFEQEFDIVTEAYMAAGGDRAVLEKAREIETRARYT